MAKLYANENFPFPVVEGLRRLGHDVLTIQETGRAGQRIPDPEVLKSATEDGRAVLTINRKHFKALHTVSTQHEGIIICTLDPDFEGQTNRGTPSRRAFHQSPFLCSSETVCHGHPPGQTFGDADARALLARWPLPRPRSWVEHVNQPQTEAEVEAVRRAIRRNSPFGNPTWQRKIARRLGLEATMRPRGRPRKASPA